MEQPDLTDEEMREVLIAGGKMSMEIIDGLKPGPGGTIDTKIMSVALFQAGSAMMLNGDMGSSQKEKQESAARGVISDMAMAAIASAMAVFKEHLMEAKAGSN